MLPNGDLYYTSLWIINIILLLSWGEPFYLIYADTVRFYNEKKKVCSKSWTFSLDFPTSYLSGLFSEDLKQLRRRNDF